MILHRLLARQALPWVRAGSRAVARVVQWNNPHGRAPRLVADGPVRPGPSDAPAVARTAGALVGTRAGGYVIDARNEVAASRLRFPWGADLHPVLTSPRLPRAQTVAGPLLNLVTPEARGNYYHWLLDQTPRLGFFRPGELRAFRTVVVGGAGLPYERETLGAAGFDPAARVIVAGGDELFAADEVWTPPLLDGEGWLPWKRDYLRSLWPAAGAGEPGRRLFVGRGNARKRRLAGEPELARALGAVGFETLDAGALSVAGQAAAFAGARVVVGVHGAALANCVFLPPGALLVEILNAQRPQVFYRDIAAAGGVRYHALFADPAGADSGDPYHANGDDLRLSPRAHDELLALVAAEQ